MMGLKIPFLYYLGSIQGTIPNDILVSTSIHGNAPQAISPPLLYTEAFHGRRGDCSIFLALTI